MHGLIRRGWILAVGVSCAIVAGIAGASGEGHGSAVAAKGAGTASLRILMEGNARYMAGKPSMEHLGSVRRASLVSGQKPLAIVLSCSDSRVPPEYVFDQGLGDIFVVRVAGNIADEVALGSLEYAAEHLGSPLLLVLGHESCGAVRAAVELKGEPEGNIGSLVRLILPAVRQARDTAKYTPGGNLMDLAVRANASMSLTMILKRSEPLFHLASSGKLAVAKAVYHLESGRVELLK